MIEIDEEETNNFNIIMIAMVENMIEQSVNNVNNVNNLDLNNEFIRFNFDAMIEEFTISNIMNMSMNEENDKTLTKDDSIELIFQK